MPDKPSFLTDPQWRILTYAVTTRPKDHPEWGKLSSYYTQHRSLDNLLRRGMITEDFDIRDPGERRKLEDHIRDCVGHARGYLLDLGSWQQALGALEEAQRHHQNLASKAYWITDAAKTYLFAH